jgi:GT2 family glycosyltransferase
MEQTRIGIGIITCNRPDFFFKCYESIPSKYADDIVIVNDGKPFDFISKGHFIQHESNKNVGYSKNEAMAYLLDVGYDYIFTLEDDIIIKDRDIFEKYIDASNKTGIQHFNFGFSQRENLDHSLKPVYRKTIDYGDAKIVLTPNILGAFTFYTRKALQTVGLHHKDFNKGHGDHLELTYRAAKHGFTTPFWWFADLYGSWDMIENQSNFTTDSVVRSKNFEQNFNEARDIFKRLHGCDIFEVPQLSEKEVINILKKIKNERD